MNDAASSLIGPHDPPPVEVLNREGKARLLLVCDHASRAIPKAMIDLRLDRAHFDRHIAYDSGAADVTRLLSKRLDATAVLAGYSRLLVDCNRPPGDPTMMPEQSDGVPIPANIGLRPDDVTARMDAFYWPYHRAIAAEIVRLRHTGTPPAIFAVHSFTPSLGGVERYWDVGVLWDRDPRLAQPLLAALGTIPGLTVGDNQPYSGRDVAYTIDVHGAAAGHAYCAVEIRQDLIGTAEGTARWADILTRALEPILADDGIYRVEHY
jgi:predicted N-formylglutamate amidohydrolase